MQRLGTRTRRGRGESNGAADASWPSSSQAQLLGAWHRHSRHDDADVVEAIVPGHSLSGCGPEFVSPREAAGPREADVTGRARRLAAAYARSNHLTFYCHGAPPRRLRSVPARSRKTEALPLSRLLVKDTRAADMTRCGELRWLRTLAGRNEGLHSGRSANYDPGCRRDSRPRRSAANHSHRPPRAHRPGFGTRSSPKVSTRRAFDAPRVIPRSASSTQPGASERRPDRMRA
jgi:hypothetical protein